MANAQTHGSLERVGGIDLDELRTLLGANPFSTSTTALPDEMMVSTQVERGRATIHLTASVPTEYADVVRSLPSVGFVVTAPAARDVDAALEWLRAECRRATIVVGRSG